MEARRFTSTKGPDIPTIPSASPRLARYQNKAQIYLIKLFDFFFFLF